MIHYYDPLLAFFVERSSRAGVFENPYCVPLCVRFSKPRELRYQCILIHTNLHLRASTVETVT